jgi:hypothetical protein
VCNSGVHRAEVPAADVTTGLVNIPVSRGGHDPELFNRSGGHVQHVGQAALMQRQAHRGSEDGVSTVCSIRQQVRLAVNAYGEAGQTTGALPPLMACRLRVLGSAVDELREVRGQGRIHPLGKNFRMPPVQEQGPQGAARPAGVASNRRPDDPARGWRVTRSGLSLAVSAGHTARASTCSGSPSRAGTQFPSADRWSNQ